MLFIFFLFFQPYFLIDQCNAIDSQDPSVLVILLDQELVVVDLTVPGYPCIEFPHPIDIHDSPVTCLKYVADSNSDLTPGLYQVAATKPKRNSGSKTVSTRRFLLCNA